MIAAEWNTEVLYVSESMRAPFMACIRLPAEIQTAYGTSKRAEHLIRKYLFEEQHIVVAIVCIQSSMWCRISANVYNVKSDYAKVAKAVLRMKHHLILGTLAKPDFLGKSLGSSPAISLNPLY